MHDRFAACDPGVPREQNRVSLSTYRVMPPDVMQIEAVYNIRAETMRLRSGDQITVRLLNGLPLDFGDESATGGNVLALYTKAPELAAKIINGPYIVQADGAVDLGAVYGKIPVAGLTIAEAKAAITKQLHDRSGLRDPKLSVSLTDVAGRQVISGQHLVRPDGTVGLGIYGAVHVAGMTLEQVRQVLEMHLSQFLHDPSVSVDVLAYNSQVYYIVLDGAGNGEQVVRLPCTGNETVLDAIAQLNGLPQVSSKRVWIARPSPVFGGKTQILSVNWQSMTADGNAATNYQLLPFDRVYVQADNLVTTDNLLAKWLAPINRVLGVTLLGTSVGQQFKQFQHGGGGSGGGGGG
ncbi:MAG TPA: polysaccharide biosynthesis/export family protein [Planctomycetaceae bacterium]|nr:polysaccharide biosynthesis/export family protein [Planctomycetaceae bacterium]